MATHFENADAGALMFCIDDDAFIIIAGAYQ